MGMDAKANVFYGYRVYFDALDDEGDYKELPDGIDIVRHWDEFYMAVKEANQRFDWDYGIQDLKLDAFQKPTADWKELLKKGCQAADLEFKEEYCGWFVICDYR
jgi:hypothetical protein